MKRIIWASVVLAVVASNPVVAQEKSGTEAAPAPKKIAISAESRAALSTARKEIDVTLRGLAGAERKTALEVGANRYAGLANELAGEAGAATQAWYESAELWRRHGSLAKAQQSYEKALVADPGSHRERALFGKAEMQRRREMPEEAIETYELVSRVKPKSNRAHTARLWIARCHEKLERPDVALAAFRAALEAAETERQVVEASNYLANVLIKRGDLDGASAAIQHAEVHCKSTIDAGGRDSGALRRVLEKMSARRALQRAKDKANQAAADAVQLEADRKKDQRTPMP